MEETIHIYIDSLHKTDTHSISMSKKRLWPSIIVSLRWLFKNPISGRTIIQNGIGLMAVNSLAIAIEGFLTDVLVEYLDNQELEKSDRIKKIENSNWNSKVKTFNKIFPTSLNRVSCYKSIETLFLLRNNTAHGRTHREESMIDITTSQLSKIESFDRNYQKARQYLKEQLFNQPDKLSNIETLWGINSSLFFMREAEIFLYGILELNKSEKFASIKSELDNAFKMTI